ncbi:MAG: PilZ domain-containing protein [bacterium]|nr:PilZ domain-containing protein [bacterium]
MTQATVKCDGREERRFLRVPLAGRMSYQCGADDLAAASCANVSRTGVQIVLGRYLRPGRHIVLGIDDLTRTGEAELKGQVVWCRPSGESHRFTAGVRVFHDDTGAVRTMSELFYEAVGRMGLLKRAAASTPKPQGERHAGWAKRNESAYEAHWTRRRTAGESAPASNMAVMAASVY